MAINDLGIVRPGSTILVPFATYDSNDPSDSVIVSAFVLADIGIYKGTSMTERASTTGVVLLDTDGINIDAAVGIHGMSIDLSSNATADFYQVGAQYYVTAGPMTVDVATTVSAIVATFRIGYPGAIHETNIATLASQVSFTLDVGSADNGAYVGCPVYVHDIASAIQVCFGYVSAYTGSTKTVTLAVDPAVFTIAAEDNISFFPPGNVQAWLGTTPATPDTAGYPVVTVKDGTGQGELNLASGVVDSNVTAMTASVITATVLATDCITSAELASTALAEIADQVWDTDATGRQNAGTFGAAIGDPLANTESIYDAVITDATGINVATDVVAMKAETVLIVADTGELQTDWFDGGRLDLILDAIPTTAMRGTDDAFLAASAPTNFSVMDISVTTGRVHVDQVSGTLQTGNDNGADLNTLVTRVPDTISLANINAEVLDVHDTDTVTLPGQVAPPLAPTEREMLSWIYKVMRNRTDQTSSLWQLYADNESTVDAKATVSDDATTAVKQEIVTGP